MCWLGSKNDIKIAEEDIKVFKIVSIRDSNIFPYFKPFSGAYGIVNSLGYYEIVKELWTSETKFEAVTSCISGIYKIERGFHSYSEEMLLERSKVFTSYLRETEHQNLDYQNFFYVCCSPKNIIQRYFKSDSLIMHCIIPKGTRYAINERGEIVSDELKVMSFEEID